MSRRVALLGSTGSIGRQAIEVVERGSAGLTLVALAAGRDLEGLATQAARARPRFLALEHAADPAAARGRLAE